MKTNTLSTESGSHTFLTGAILFANLDYSGFAGYAVKAIIGGVIWMAFKLVGDYLSYKLLKKEKSKEKDFKSEEKED
jgi:hypothetical protein